MAEEEAIKTLVHLHLAGWQELQAASCDAEKRWKQLKEQQVANCQMVRSSNKRQPLVCRLRPGRSKQDKNPLSMPPQVWKVLLFEGGSIQDREDKDTIKNLGSGMVAKKRDVWSRVCSCHTGQHYEVTSLWTVEVMQSAEVKAPEKIMGVHCTSPFPLSKAGNITLIIVIDYHTKWV
ncbi:hypothetical protein MHYP_G00312540 [Metynnis hypsauchen]